MAAGTVVTAAGAAVLLYYVLARTIKGGRITDTSSMPGIGKRKMTRRPAQAPATWLETLTTISDTLRFTYAETLGKWPIADLAFGINYLMRRHGNVELVSVYGGSNCTRLSGHEIVAELKYFVRLLTICIFFSKRPFPAFLELSGYADDDVLVHKPKAGILKPAFTVIRDKETKHFLLLIRGTHSIKDTLTAATGAVVPFHHSVLNDGGVTNLVLGYAHCGMVAAARWIAKLSSPFLLKALEQYPDYSIKVVGHSLGGGTAALLTYILREQKEFSSSICVTFAPAACMTWELAESGNPFVTTVINGADLVPSFSSASVDDLRCEVTASSWLSDLRDQVEHTRVLNVVYRSATALGSRLPSVRERVAGARSVIKRAQDVAQALAKTRPVLSSWSCIGPRRRPLIPVDVEESQEAESGGAPLSDEEEALVCRNGEETEEALWNELENELRRRDDDDGEEEIIIEEESLVVVEEESLDEISENFRFYPPGRILHVVCSTGEDGVGSDEGHVALYETPRELYGKIRFSRTMINDHYMPVYKKMIERLIRELDKEDENEILVL